ncbi:MAG: fumarylacetoacetate hydrolase [Actinobacteria bacterium]|nr:fumarylacetoacetate hydrolase [Actinomycetota bacterium]
MTFKLANVNDRASLVVEDLVFDLERASNGTFSSDVMGAIARHQELHTIAKNLFIDSADWALAEVKLGAPVPHPRNSFGVGLNYRDHAAESSMELPPVPVVFSKYPSCINGPFNAIDLRTDTADYEAELVVVIGSTTRDVSPSRAWEHVAGITCGQDISDRGLQMAAKPPHFGLGKSRDSYGPTGPLLVSTDVVANPNDLKITCSINGEVRQADRTSNMVFDVPYLISYLSNVLTLEAGDIIFTGTPAGVGAANGRFLKPGDEVVTEIEGIGLMRNNCI